MHSTLAPQSMSRLPPLPVGMMGARAARRMPRMRLTYMVEPTSTAPVLPPETRASPFPSPSMRRPTAKEESFFSLVTLVALSHISITSGAFTTSSLSVTSLLWARSRQARISLSRPTRITSAPSSRAASTAPSTVLWGALSPPIASKMIFIRLFPPSLALCTPQWLPARAGILRYTGCACPAPGDLRGRSVRN